MEITNEAGECKDPSRGKFLESEMKKYQEENPALGDSEPTEEEITRQIRLPTWQPDKIKELYQEPLRKWVSVDPSEKYTAGDEHIRSRRSTYADWLGEDRVPTWDKKYFPKKRLSDLQIGDLPLHPESISVSLSSLNSLKRKKKQGGTNLVIPRLITARKLSSKTET